MSHSIRKSCRLCSSEALRLVLDLGHTPLANEYPPEPRPQRCYPLHLVECESCGHVQLPVVVDPELLFGEYAYTSSTAASFRQHVQQLAAEVSGPGETLVDIGSNDGLLCREAQALGSRTLGIDPARNLAAEATQRGQITLPHFMTRQLAVDVRKLLRHATVVTALNVFAHADDLGEIADAVRELIYPSGTFVFEVAYLLDVLEKNEIGTIYHEHLSHHHVAPLIPFFKNRGMSLVRVSRVPSQGGSIRCYVRGTTGDVPDPSIGSLLALERERLPALLNGWPERVRQEQVRLITKIGRYAGNGLAIYGAPARLTTYVYTMGLRQSDVTCVFDDEPKKLGRFTPGMHWPIVSSSELMERNPPAVLVAAWPYFEDIKRRFPDYRGEWIVPERSGA